MKMKVIFRGFLERKVIFEDRVEVEEATLRELASVLSQKHGIAMAEHAVDMIEIEFLDELDPEQRYFRIGTNPRGMVMPIERKPWRRSPEKN